jgi:hypothetical protein
MPKKIHTFKTVEKAKAVLSNFNKHFKYPQHTDQENSFIVKKSVGGSLFRAFKGISEPSKIYRNWANKKFDTIISTFSTIKKISEYDDYIDKLNNSLLNQWCKQTGTKLGYGPSIKMVNLLIKMIIEEKKYHRQKLIPFLHIPFDQYTLRPLRNIINDLTDINYKINIPQTATMKFVNTKELYVILLKTIRNLSRSSGIDPIIYEYWSWNDKH